MRQIFVITCFLLSFASYGTDLGKELPVQMDSKGIPQFGVHYLYDGDFDGPAYRLLYKSKVSFDLGGKLYRWNYYLRSSDSFLLEWSKDRKVFVGIIQAKIDTENLAGVVNKIVRGQKGGTGGELFFVLADEKNKPLYYISLSELCSKYPDNFNDLTHGYKCYDPK